MSSAQRFADNGRAHSGMNDVPDSSAAGSTQQRLLRRAQFLVTVSVVWGALSGSFALALGLIDGSLAVLGVGLGVLADLSGSAVLIWRFRTERRHPFAARVAEERARTVVAAALCVTSAVLVTGSVYALVVETRPGTSVLALVGTGVTLAVLAPLATAKRRAGTALRSPALQGDATLSAVGAAMSLFALVGLLCFRLLGWWGTDRAAALMGAAMAAFEAYRIIRSKRHRRIHGAEERL